MIYPQIAKYDLPQIVCTIYPPQIAREDLPLKSPSTIYPPKIAKYDLPQIVCTIYPPLKSSNFEQNFKRTQHHALLQKGLFCERPISSINRSPFSAH